MNRYRLTGILLLFLLAAVLLMPVFAMDAQQQKEFDRILAMSYAELTESATVALRKRYPGEKWEAYRFPDFVSTNASSEAGYRIAIKRPELLAKIHCACACEVAGHKNLLDCYLKNGQPGVYDRHASFCGICNTQAMLAFLWAELGATDREIADGMEKRLRPKGTFE